MPSRVKFLDVSTDLRKGGFSYYDLEFSQIINKEDLFSEETVSQEICDYKIHLKNKWWIKYFFSNFSSLYLDIDSSFFVFANS